MFLAIILALVVAAFAIYVGSVITAFIMGLFEPSDAVKNSYSGGGVDVAGTVVLILESLLPWVAIPAAVERRHKRIQREKTITRS